MDDGVLRSDRFHDSRGVIGRSIIDYGDFRAPRIFLDAPDHFSECGSDARLFVVGGNYDAVVDFHCVRAAV